MFYRIKLFIIIYYGLNCFIVLDKVFLSFCSVLFGVLLESVKFVRFLLFEYLIDLIIWLIFLRLLDCLGKWVFICFRKLVRFFFGFFIIFDLFSFLISFSMSLLLCFSWCKLCRFISMIFVISRRIVVFILFINSVICWGVILFSNFVNKLDWFFLL